MRLTQLVRNLQSRSHSHSTFGKECFRAWGPYAWCLAYALLIVPTGCPSSLSLSIRKSLSVLFSVSAKDVLLIIVKPANRLNYQSKTLHKASSNFCDCIFASFLSHWWVTTFLSIRRKDIISKKPLRHIFCYLHFFGQDILKRSHHCLSSSKVWKVREILSHLVSSRNTHAIKSTIFDLTHIGK